MISKKEILFEIKEYPLAQYIVGLLCVIWIGFSIYMFEVNQVFFGITSGVSIFVILMLNKMHLVLTKDSLIIMNKRIFPRFSIVKEFPISEIEQVTLDSGLLHNDFRLNKDISIIFPYAPWVVRMESLEIKRKNEKWKKYQLLSSNENYERLIELIENKTNLNTGYK